ncbi:MAG: extracellular solute-binding protein [Spirochaetota bacterium]
MKARMCLTMVLALLVLLSGVAFAAGQSESGGEATGSVAGGPYNPLEPYDPPITLTRGLNEANRTFPPGQSWEDNVWTRAWSERLGIDIVTKWAVPSNEYESKLNVAIASGDLPDVIQAPYDIFYRLAEGGQLEDLSQAYENANDPLFKSEWERDGGLAKEMLSVDGSLYGVGSTVSPGPIIFLAYRNDWADAVGADSPETFEDVIDMMYAFAEDDPNGDGSKTYGLALAEGLWATTSHLGGFFAAYDAHPQIWIEKDGRIEYGGIQPEAREALLSLQQLFADEVLDPEFALKSPWVELVDDVTNGKVGLSFGIYWWTDYAGVRNLIEAEGSEATWTMMRVPAIGGGVAEPQAQTRIQNTLSMRRGVGYPEAIIKLFDFQASMNNIAERMEGEFNYMPGADGTPVRTVFYNFLGINVGFGEIDQGMRIAEAVRMDARDSLPEADYEIYDRVLDYEENGTVDNYGFWGKYGPESGSVLAFEIMSDGDYTPNAYYGPNTDTMNRLMGNITGKMNEVYTRIIMGAPIEEFDEWVDFFNEQGGAEITEEVNAWAAARD